MSTDLRAPSTRLAVQLRLDLTLHSILTVHLRDETPGSRLRQFGMMAVLIELAANGTPLTVSAVTTVTGMTRGAAELILKSLEERGLIKHHWTRNSIGRGKARTYEFTI